MKDSLKVKIGNITILIESGDNRIIKAVTDVYIPFESRQRHVYRVRLTRCKIRLNEGMPKDMFFSFAKGFYKIDSSEFQAVFDLFRKEGSINIFIEKYKEVVVSALGSLCMLLTLRSGGAVFHASGIVKSGRAFVFLGPSGAGKSTVAEASKGLTVLSEELIGLHLGNVPKAFAIPYYTDSRFPLRSKGMFEVAGLFKLVKDRRNYLKSIPMPYAVADFFTFVSSFKGLIPLSRYFNACSKLIESSPCYELHFLPDNSFWRCIDESLN